MTDAPNYRMQIRWSDLDANGHVRHSVYLDLGAQARVGFLASHGLSVKRFQELAIGPVLFSEAAQYMRELHSSETVTVDVWLTGLSTNGKHWSMRHHIRRADGELCCVVDCRGAWFDTRTRKVVPMPEEVASAMAAPPRTDDFKEITGRSPGA